jgi:hypothetical protein
MVAGFAAGGAVALVPARAVMLGANVGSSGVRRGRSLTSITGFNPMLAALFRPVLSYYAWVSRKAAAGAGGRR